MRQLRRPAFFVTAGQFFFETNISVSRWYDHLLSVVIIRTYRTQGPLVIHIWFPHLGSSHFCSNNQLQQCKTAWVEVHSVLVCKDGSVLIHCVVPCRPVAAIDAEILRGRRPPSVQWSSVKAQDAKKTIPGAQPFQGSISPVTRVAKECSPGPLPEEVMSAVQAAVVRLEKALGALDDTDVAATQALQSALERARAKERPLKEHIKEAEFFDERGREGIGECRRQAEDALKEARAQRVRHQEELKASQARLEKLGADSSSSFSSISHSLHGGVSDHGAQITTELRSSASNRWSTSCRQSDMHSRRGCTSKIVVRNRWGSWCQDMNGAVSRGSVHDISRLAESLAQGATEAVDSTQGAHERINAGRGWSITPRATAHEVASA